MAIPLLTTPYLSRVLGSEGIGSYSYAYTVAYYFVLFAMLGVNNYGNRTIAISRSDKKELSKNFWGIYFFQLLLSFVITIVYLFYAFYFAADKNIALIMFFYVLSAGLDINWFFFGIENFRITVIRNSIIKLMTLLCIFLFVKSSQDVNIYAFINVIGILLSQIVLWIVIRRYINFEKVSIKEILSHVKPNIILFIPVIAISLYKMMDKVMLAQLADFSQVGFFETSEKIIQIPLAIVTSIGTVMLPKISHIISKGMIETSEKYLERSMWFTLLIISAMSFGIMGVSKEFVPLFYGQGYEVNILLFQILLPSCIFIAIANIIRTQFLIPHKMDSIYIKSTILGAVVNIIINLLLIPNMAAIGAAIGTFFAEMSVCLFQIYSIRKSLPIGKYIIKASPFVIIGFMMYLLLYHINLDFSNFQNLIIKIAIGIIIYLISLVIFYVIQKRSHHA
ncbi:oligosaccharide flippase family protein [Streptococcus sp. CSL7508-lung]|uniref:Oligosaccharide flippase family protein n=2 Tax=Streptococcus zalophi TaxID=640031 RepID=A0A934UD16_9STRE|nr:oligosaccharide flippase family protein [Streptococcus zalophi]